MTWLGMVVPMFREVVRKFMSNERLTREEKQVCISIIALACREVMEDDRYKEYAYLLCNDSRDSRAIGT